MPLHHPVIRSDLHDSLSYRERTKSPIFTRDQVEHAVQVVPRIKGVFEKFYKTPKNLESFKNIAHMELSLANLATSDVIKLERLQIAEAALDIYDFLKRGI